MTECNESAPVVEPITVDEADVVKRYKELMVASIEEDSLYERSKNTLLELSKELNMTEKERMDVVAGQITQMTVGLSGNAMQTALGWATFGSKIGYELALLKAQASKAMAEAEVEANKICLTQQEVAYKCAQTIATLAGTIRDNGMHTVDATGCNVISIADEGLKYEQTLQVNASKYQILAEAYRKSGVVTLSVGTDSVLKGYSGTTAGHTYEQTQIARRQVASFEDSKRNHAANASSQTMGQILSAEGVPSEWLQDQYEKALSYLNQDTVLDPNPGGGTESLTAPTEIFFNGSSITDNTVDQVLTQTNNSVTGLFKTGMAADGGANSLLSMKILFDGSQVRANDELVIEVINGDNDIVVMSETSITNGYVIFRSQSITWSDGAAGTAEYPISAYFRDVAGNTSPTISKTVNITYVI